jgi:hypothetical protein
VDDDDGAAVDGVPSFLPSTHVRWVVQTIEASLSQQLVPVMERDLQVEFMEEFNRSV